jgi:hypothetical protein
MKIVTYCADSLGYTVQVTDNGELLDEYITGNCHGDSTSIVEPGSLGSVDVATLEKWAEVEALETAAKLGIDAKQVSYDPDMRGDDEDETPKPETIVIFRKWKDGDVIALFPYEPSDYEGYLCNSYMHIGQHSGANPRLVDMTIPVSSEEYADLKRELESEPYNYVLKVRRRMPSDAMDVRRAKIKEMA